MKRIGRLNGRNHGDLAVSLDAIPPLTCGSMLSYHVTADYKSAALPLRHAGRWSHPAPKQRSAYSPAAAGRRCAPWDAARQGHGAAGTRPRSTKQGYLLGPRVGRQPTRGHPSSRAHGRACRRKPSLNMARRFPEDPDFPPGRAAEAVVFETLADNLPDEAAVFWSIPFTDDHGETEADVIVAWPAVGRRGPDPAIRPASSTPAPSTESSCPTWRPWRIRPAGRASTSSAGTLRKACRAGRHG